MPDHSRRSAPAALGAATAAAVALAGICLPAWAQTWGVVTHDGGGRQVAPYLSSLARGEGGIGAVRTEDFKLDADLISFEICGHDGPPGQRRMRNWFELCDAETGLALRRAAPSATDSMTPVTWDVVELIGRRVYFRAMDGVAEGSFAWFGVGKVRVGERQVLGEMTAGRMPDGWTQETQPEGVSTDDWLRCRSASERYAVEVEGRTPTWGVITVNGERRACAPYLSSLRGGEQSTGAVRSPAFVVAGPTYTFLQMGADSPTGDAGLNLFQLVDAKTLEILRQSEPTVGNTLVPTTWDVKDLAGRRVFFRALDLNEAGGWAWIGCDQVPLGQGRVARFAEAGALDGWREEGQAEGAIVGGAQPRRSLAEMVEAEWAAQDAREGVRWALWETNRDAAPWIMRRMARVMDDGFRRGEALARDFLAQGARADDVAAPRAALRRLRERVDGLKAHPYDTEAWRQARHEQRLALREMAFRNPLLSFDKLLFAKRFTQQSYSDINVNHHAWGSRPGGDIFILTGFRGGGAPSARPLIAGRLGPGNVHGLDLDWDARRIVFAYSRAASDQPPDGWLSRQATFDLHRTVDLLHLYEMATDGSGLHRLTQGQWSDLNPCYLPSGDIAFESERCALELECNEGDKDEPTTNLYALHRDGGSVERLTVNKDGDWYPRVLNDGSICYCHWEYHERGLMFLHPLWGVRPDGTMADNYAKQHFDYPLALTAPRPVPGSDKVMAIAAGHHTLASGPVVLVQRARGMNEPGCVERLTGPDIWPELGGAAPGPRTPGWCLPPGQGWYMDPYPLSETTYLAAYCDGGMVDEAGYGLYLMDAYGGKELLYRDPVISSVMPVPLRARVRAPILASGRDPTATDARLIATDVISGVPELKAGEVKYLRVGEPVAWPYDNEIGGQRYDPDAKATGVNWTPVRILGTVPVEPDGSAYFRVPADTAVYFQALDARGMELRRMRSYISFRPGETRSCTGCHETKTEGPPTGGVALALNREPSVPQPPPWALKPISFLRDVQPVLNRNCLRCHGGLKPAAGVDLSPGLTAEHNRAYDALMDPARWLLATASKGDNSRITPVRAFGAHASRLTAVLEGSHRERCALTADDWGRLCTWMDANAVYHDDFIHKRGPLAEVYSIADDKALWDGLAAISKRRCGACHGDAVLARPEWVDLDDPARSLFLTAPLAGAATPTGKHCAPAVYADAGDADYAAALALVREAVGKTWQRPRRDLWCLTQEGLRPSVFLGLEPVGRTAQRP